jgi:hypothetical protein
MPKHYNTSKKRLSRVVVVTSATPKAWRLSLALSAAVAVIMTHRLLFVSMKECGALNDLDVNWILASNDNVGRTGGIESTAARTLQKAVHHQDNDEEVEIIGHATKQDVGRNDNTTAIDHTFSLSSKIQRIIWYGTAFRNNPSSPNTHIDFALINRTNHDHFYFQQPGWFDKRRKLPTVAIKLPLPVLVVNMPKTGTSTIKKFFDCGLAAGRWSNHWKNKDLTGKELFTVEIMSRNFQLGLPLLQGCGGWAVYTDSGGIYTNVTAGERQCFYPVVQQHGLETFAQDYPNATILHLPRSNTSAWVQSAKHWKNLTGRWDDYCSGLQPDHNILFADKRTRLTTDEEWASWYERNYTQRIRDFAKLHPSLTYVESSLDDVEGTGLFLEKVTALPAACFGHHHVTKGIV